MANHRQLTMRELMLVFVFAGLGLAGLSTGGALASAVVGIAGIVATCSAIVAFVGRDQLRSFAIGFLVPIIVYAATVFSIGKSELNPYQGKLPTTKLIQPAFQLIVKQEHFNYMTGEVVPDYVPPASNANPGGPIGIRETPDRTTFMSLAHVLLALMFGYVGAKFAVWVHRRQALAKDSAD